jgi:FecR protein
MLKRLSLVVLLVGTSSAWAQQVISAHSGVIHLVEGQVTLDGTPVQPKFAEFPDVKNGQTLASQDGRAEVLMNPGVILRIGENSSFKMLSNSRSDTRLQVLTGEAVVEVGELLSTNAITIVYGDVHVELIKRGLYQISADPGKLRVYEGEARVTEGNQTLVARKGREVLMGAVLDMNGFDVKDVDALMRWASRRSEALAQANVSSARTASSQGYTGSGYGSGYGYGPGMMGGMWAYNPWYGMFTYLPYGNGMYYSPFFGYPYYSAGNVGYFVPGLAGGGVRSAFPVNTGATSPHYNGVTGGSSLAPRGSYGTAGGNSGGGTAPASSGFSGAGARGGGMSTGGGASSGGGMSSGAGGHAGGGGGMGGGGHK